MSVLPSLSLCLCRRDASHLLPSSCKSTGTSADSIGGSRDARRGGRRCWWIGAVPWLSTLVPTEAPPRSLSPNLNSTAPLRSTCVPTMGPCSQLLVQDILVAPQRSSLPGQQGCDQRLQGWPWAPPDQWLVNLPLCSLSTSLAASPILRHLPGLPSSLLSSCCPLHPTVSTARGWSKGERHNRILLSPLRAKTCWLRISTSCFPSGHLLKRGDLVVCVSSSQKLERAICSTTPREVSLRRSTIHPSLSSRKCEKATRAPGQPPSSQVSRKPWNPHTHL